MLERGRQGVAVARVFVAVWPPAVVTEQLLSLPRPAGPDLRWVPPANLHVTLRFLGDAPVTVVADRLRAAALPAARAELGPATRTLGHHVLMVPVAGLDELAAAVALATGDLGQLPKRSFTGHVTLARARTDGAAARLAGAPVTGTFDVTEVTVVTSETHPDGARYATVATLPCRTVRSRR